MDVSGIWSQEVGPALTYDMCHNDCKMLLLMHPLVHLLKPRISEYASR